ncbi:MAG: helix-turn-helix transcriptional regulator [Clostridia bacterium]|nr:helix-turn-helix transcriptional regulator [Clostridia bacterium]
MHSISRREDGSEILSYNDPEYPVRTFIGTLSIFADYAAECHWHHDFEVFIADQNSIDYYVNGQIVHLKQGEAIFVNSGRLHYGFSPQQQECYYRFAVFHPMLFGGVPAIAAKLDSLTSDTSTDWWLFTADDPDTLGIIDRLCNLGSPEDSLMFQSTAALLLNRVCQLNETSGTADPEWAILRRMTGFIQLHYTERILLADIAASGNVCRSRCCELFRTRMHTTPNTYLTRYRLARAGELIRSGKSITEAALASGFQSTSYFSEAFSKQYGMAPREAFRKEKH